MPSRDTNPGRVAGRLGVTLALTLLLAGCEEHKAPAISSAPEVQHDALSGKISAQAWLEGCYAAGGQCVGVAPDPALACAWSTVRLLSGSSELTLADNEANARLCNLANGSERQRAGIAATDFAERVYGKGALATTPLTTAPGDADVLYPSPEMVRTRVNAALARTGRSERLPAFSSPAANHPADSMNWSACAEPACLQVEAPANGGGVLRYQVAVRIAGLGVAEAAKLVGALAASGMDAGSLAAPLGDGRDHEFARGPVCWRSASNDRSTVSVTASRAPCRGP